MDQRILRDLLRGDSRADRSWKCPREGRMAAFADGQIEESLRVKIERHLASCEHCRQRVAFLVRSEAGAGDVEVPADLVSRAKGLVAEKPPPAFGWGWRWGAVTAVVTMLVLVVTLRVDRPETLPIAPPAPTAPLVEVTPSPAVPVQPKAARPERVVRNTDRRGPLPEILFPRDGSILPGPLTEIRWKGVAGAIFYEVQMVTAEGNIVWEGRTESTRLAVSIKRAPAPVGKHFIWVRAHLPDGKTARSSVVSFQISTP